jgi:hypothetical protein
VMSSMTWFTRLSVKAHFSGPRSRDFESSSLESAGDGKVAFVWLGPCRDDKLRGPSRLAMCASKKSAMLRGASCPVELSNPMH